MLHFIESMKRAVKNWWISLLMGILAIVMGIFCFAAPGASLIGLTYIFVIGFILGGILDIVFAVSNRDYVYGWGWTLAAGILELLLGVMLFTLPAASITVILVYFVGFWILFRSIWSIGESAQLRMLRVKGWGWALALSILCTILSFLYLLSPTFSKGVFVIALVGISMLVYGIFRIVMAFEFRQIGKQLKE
ncbi:MAG: HdeD family acid-resistance protein [Fermentimonas sp.]|jgi:uncharacterized membrane protein HdeD (DUF308 family)